MSDSIFSKIIRGEAPGSFIYRDLLVSVFLDVEGMNPGHCLVVPNEAAACLAELDPETGNTSSRLPIELQICTVQVRANARVSTFGCLMVRWLDRKYSMFIYMLCLATLKILCGSAMMLILGMKADDFSLMKLRTELSSTCNCTS